jgi:hypothetical protein
VLPTDRRFPRRSWRAEREFGLLVGAILVALAGWWTYREKFAGARLGFFVVGGALLAAGLVWPRLLALPYRGWMALAEGLSRIVTTLVLLLVYCLVVTPSGVFKRLGRWDPLGRRAARADSYWRPYDPRQADRRHFEKMF